VRITFVTPVADVSGGARIIHQYAKALQERGHVVCVISKPQELSFKRRVRSFLSGQGWPPRLAMNETFYDPACYDLRLARPFRPIDPSIAPDADIIIATWWETAEWIEKFPASKGKKVHFVQGYEAFPGMPKDRVDAVLRLPTYKIAVSTWLSEMLKTEFGANRVALVPNAVDTRQFYAEPRAKQTVPTIGLVYSGHPVKDCRTAFRAFGLIKKKHPAARMIMFGKSSPRASLPIPRGSKFILLPPQEQIREIYSSCDVWLCSSRSEGFGLPVLEAMACRCPVVSTAVAGPVDLITDGVEGYLVPIGDAKSMAEKLDLLLSLREAEWRRMSDAAYATAKRHSSCEAINRFEAALREAAQ